MVCILNVSHRFTFMVHQGQSMKVEMFLFLKFSNN